MTGDKEVETRLPDGRGRGRTSQARIARLKALELRMLGLTYLAIGEKLGRSESWAHKAVQQALKEQLQEKAEAVRALELARLDKVQQRVYLDAANGNLQAVDRLLRVMERRARYLDLDNPRLNDAVQDGIGLLQSIQVQLQAMPDTYEAVDDHDLRQHDDDLHRHDDDDFPRRGGGRPDAV